MPPRGNSTRYIGLLRAVNLGGVNQVAMSALRDLFTRLGFRRPTDLASERQRRVRCHQQRADGLEAQLEAEIKHQLQMEHGTEARLTGNELRGTMRPFLIWACALMLAACSPVAGQNSMVGSSPPDTLPFERLDSRELRIPDAGWALIRNQERWKKLWRDYGREAYRNGELAVPDAPDVDFDRNEVLAVSFGPKSDCSSKVVIVEHVLEYARERVAIITPDHFAQGGPCQMIVEPIDLVVIPRSDKVMRLELVTRMKESHWKVPAQASWWVPLRAHAARDSGTTWATRRAYILSRRVLPRDTTLPLRDYRVLAAEAYASRDGYIKGKLRRNRRAMADRDVVAWLAVDPQDDVAELRYDFLRRFGLQVASDDWVPRVWLAMLIELLMSPGTKRPDGTAPYRDVALALTHNAAVLSDTLLAMRLTFGTQYYPDVQAIACRRYLERYPRVLVDQSDSRGGGLMPNCPN